MTDERNEAVEKVAQAVERFDFNGDDYHPEWGRAVAQAALDAINYEATLADLAAMRAENERLRKRWEACNMLLRSAYQITERERGKPNSTNWDAFSDRLSEELAHNPFALDAAHREEPT